MVQDGYDMITCGLAENEYYPGNGFLLSAKNIIETQLKDINFGEQELKPVYDIVSTLIDRQMNKNMNEILSTNYCLYIDGNPSAPISAAFILGYSP